MKYRFLMIHHITFANVFLNDIFEKIHIYNDIKKLIKILLTQMAYMNML